MTGLPEKLRSGDSFKNGVFEKINALIEYCRTHELRGDNRTVRINRNASGITISAIARNHPGTAAGIASGAGRYTGYFKLALIETDETGEDGEPVRKYSVAIVDGATYDPDQTPLSGNSVCKVNNVTFSRTCRVERKRRNRSGSSKSRDCQSHGGRLFLPPLRHIENLLLSARARNRHKHGRNHARDDSAGS